MDQGEVRTAVIAMQQLPKIYNAFSNMAKRSRRRLERKGVYLGGFWLSNNEEIPKQNGILKRSSTPNVGQLSAYNEFWRSFSYSCKTDDFDSPITTRDSWSITRPHRTSDFAPSPVSNRMSQAYIGNNGPCRSQTSALLESIPVHISNFETLKQIDLAYLKNNQLDSKEYEIILELQYLKILSNISFYKLLRKRPLEYVLPLPRKPPRLACTRAKSLVAYQSVPNLPTQNYKIKWLRFNTNNYQKNFSEFGNDPPRVVVLKKAPKKGKFYYSTTIPKGVAFLTYPDLVDNNSFEGTIGGRNMISWEQGTKFPEMGIDQSEDFKIRKEMGRQNMIRNRLQAARIRKGASVNMLNTATESSDGRKNVYRRHSFFYLPTKKSNSHHHQKHQQRPLLKRLRRSHAPQPPLKLSSFIWNPFRSKRPSQVEALSTHSSMDLVHRTLLPTHTEVARRFTCRGKAIVRAERRRRLKICLRVTVGCLSCGLIPLFTKGECMFRKRRLRTMRTEDSRQTEGSTFDGNQS